MPTLLRPETVTQTSLVQQDPVNVVAGDVNIEQLSVVYYTDKSLTISALLNNETIRQSVKDIVPRVQQIDLYYSIFTPTIYCELQCVDAVDDLHSRIDDKQPAEQYLYLQYRSPFLKGGQSIRLLFRIYKISDVTVSPLNRTRTYTIYASSPEAIDNVDVTVYRSLRTNSGQAGNSIDQIVPNIISTDLRSEKTVDIEPTSGIVDRYLYNLYPLEAIDYLKQIATNSSRQTGSYVFFEKPTGYVFRTLEDLFERGQQTEIAASYVFDTIGNSDFSLDQYSRVLAYNQPTFVDNYSKIVSGGFANYVNSFDVITGKYRSVEYQHSQSKSKFKYAQPADRAQNNSDRFIDQYSTGTYSKYIVEAATDRQTNLAEKLANQQAYALELAQNIVQVSVHGNSEVMIGDVIGLQLLVPSAMTGPGDNSQTALTTAIDSGKYLISRARDTINISGRPQHLQSFELINGQLLLGRQL